MGGSDVLYFGREGTASNPRGGLPPPGRKGGRGEAGVVLFPTYHSALRRGGHRTWLCASPLCYRQVLAPKQREITNQA